MDQVHESIWIGSKNDLTRETLAATQIAAILSLTGQTLAAGGQEGLGVQAIEVRCLADGSNHLHDFRQAVTTLDTLVRNHGRVLVHCHAGRSRSPAVVAGWMVMYQAMKAADAFRHIASHREVNVTPELVQLVNRLRSVTS